MEEWRNIPGYEGIYQVSNLGNVRTCEEKTTFTERHGVRHWKQRVLKVKLSTNKYGRHDARVSLWKDGQEQTWLVARLVGLAWCGGYSEGMTINHINGNATDNRAENLEWVSRKENIQHGYKTGLYSSCQKPIVLENSGVTHSFLSMAEASRFLGRNCAYVSNALKRGHHIKAVSGEIYSPL